MLCMYSAIGGSIVGGLFDFLGGLQQASATKKAAKDAWQRTLQLYSTRYQITMNDMRKAGLNPILAYQQGVGATPSAPTAGPFPNVMEGLGSSARGVTAAYQEAKARQAGLLNLTADTAQKGSQTELNAQNRETAAALQKVHDKNVEVLAASAKDIEAAAEKKRVETDLLKRTQPIAQIQEELSRKGLELGRGWMNDLMTWWNSGNDATAKDVKQKGTPQNPHNPPSGLYRPRPRGR